MIELNPDPAGNGIVQGQLANIVPITLGATALVMTSIVGMRSSVISAYQLPIGTDLCEAYLRQNLAKVTLPMDRIGFGFGRRCTFGVDVLSIQDKPE